MMETSQFKSCSLILFNSDIKPGSVIWVFHDKEIWQKLNAIFKNYHTKF